MNDSQGGSGSLLDTTDCLEAVGVFRGWKNFLFIIMALGLLLVQASFWLVKSGFVHVPEGPAGASSAVSHVPVPDVNAAAKVAVGPNEPNVAKVQTAADEKQPRKGFVPFEIRFGHVRWVIRFADAVLALTAMLYCLTMLFSLKVSLMGRLGGINHVARAFFTSLLMVVLLLPWQVIFGPALPGAIYLPSELKWCAAKHMGVFDLVLFYLRFSGYWLLVVLLLVLAQLRSSRWTGAILRRLEVI